MAAAPATAAQLAYATRLQADLRQYLAWRDELSMQIERQHIESAISEEIQRGMHPDYTDARAAERAAHDAEVEAAGGGAAWLARMAAANVERRAAQAAGTWQEPAPRPSRLILDALIKERMSERLVQQQADAEIDLTTLDRASISAWLDRR